MTLTDIRRTKKGRFSIYVDGEFAFSISALVLAECGAEPGVQLTPQQLYAIQQADCAEAAKQKAFRLLSAKSYTGKQLADKLASLADEETVQAVVEQMRGYGYINDLDYALRRSRDLVNLKGLSLASVCQELRRQGVDEETVQEALAQFDDDDPCRRIRQVLMRKYRTALGSEKGRARAMSGLLRLGYRYDDIRRAINSMLEEEAEEE